jgi:hypothetical protein
MVGVGWGAFACFAYQLEAANKPNLKIKNKRNKGKRVKG